MSGSARAVEPGRDPETTVRLNKRRPDRRDGPAGLVALQRAAGNAAVSALIGAGPGRATGESVDLGLIAVQRDPDPSQAFAEQWMKQHIVIGNAEFKQLAALPDADRQAVLAEIRRRYGNEYIRRGEAGTLPDKEPDAAAAEAISTDDYWKKYGGAHMAEALQQVVAKIDIDIAGPGLAFDSGESGAFANFALAGRMQQLELADVTQLLGTPLQPLIEGVRLLDDLGRGADAYEPAVTERILERLGLGLRQAAASLALPYALARAKAIADARGKGPPGMAAPGPLVEPDADAVLQTQPPPLSFGARTTLEHAAAEAFCSGRFVGFDENAFGMLYVPRMSDEPRPVELELERGSGEWKVARVVKPVDASAAEVANTLYGSPENADLVVGRAGRYVFAFPPNGRLAEPYDTIWREHIEQDEGGGPIDLIRGRAPGDPLLELDDDAAELRALDTAADVPADGDQSAVVQRLEIIQSLLTSISTAAEPLGVAGFVDPILTAITERLAACAADPQEAQKWSGHSAVQAEVLSEVKTGFDAITQQLFATGLPAVSTPEGEQLVGDVTASVQGPTLELTGAFAAVVSAADQLDIARERLGTAKQRLAAYPFDMADRLLAMIRKRIAELDGYATIGLQSFSRGRLDALQAEISQQVAELRIAVVNGDGTATNRLSELKNQLAMLDLQSTVGSTISLIHDLKGLLFASESWSPDTDREWQIYNELQAAIQPWLDLGGDYDRLWQSGADRNERTLADIRARVETLRKATPLPKLIQEAASFQEDEAKRQRVIAIGVMIAAALIAAVTGGLASGAIGGAAGAIVGAGLESLTFTAITGTLNQDQTFGGFMAELGINFATFGGLRAISGGAKLLAAGSKLTLAGRAAEMTVEGLWMVAMTKANEEIQARLNRGEKMTTQTAASIFGHQMLLSFATRVIARAGGALIQGRAEINRLQEVQLFLAKQQEAKALAQGFLDKQDDAVGAALVKADTEALRAEVAARQKINEMAGELGLTEAELASLAAGTQSAARELTEREINLLMEQAETRADHVIAEPDVYAQLVAKHRKLGSLIVEGFDAAGSPKAKITAAAADGSFGSPFTLHSRLGAEAEEILQKKGLRPSAVVHQYLAKRAGDRAAALADLQKVNSAAELDALMKRTLGRPSTATGEGASVRSAEDRATRAEREATWKRTKAERNRLEREAHPDWPAVNGRPVRPRYATDSYYEWRASGGNFIKANLSADGTLDVTIKALGLQRASGRTLMDAVFKHFGDARVKQFKALWVRGTGFEANYVEYIGNLATMTPENAAWNTWTGRYLSDHEFHHVTVPQHGPNPASVAPVFSR